jgi:hypothetical protein
VAEERGVSAEKSGLTPAERTLVLALALAVFFFGAGPVWRHPWSPDASILWSYAVIPALVLVFLVRRHVLRLGALLSESLVLSVFKFGISAIVLICFWSFSKPPAAVKRERAFDREEKTEISLKGEEEKRIALNGEERGDAAMRGTPVASIRVEIGYGRITPSVIHLESSTPIEFRSSDGQLHSLELIAADGSVRANVPILASGLPRSLSFMEVFRASSVRCAIHPKETATITR